MKYYFYIINVSNINERIYSSRGNPKQKNLLKPFLINFVLLKNKTWLYVALTARKLKKWTVYHG